MCRLQSGVELDAVTAGSSLMSTWAPTPGGRGGRVPPAQKSEGDVPPEIVIFTAIFKELAKNFTLFRIFKIKWPKSEEKTEFGGRWV